MRARPSSLRTRRWPDLGGGFPWVSISLWLVTLWLCIAALMAAIVLIGRLG